MYRYYHHLKAKHLLVTVIVALLSGSPALATVDASGEVAKHGDIDLSPVFKVACQDDLIPGLDSRNSRFSAQPKPYFQIPQWASYQPDWDVTLEEHSQVDQTLMEETMISHKGVFVENRGQWPEEVKYQVRLGGLDAWITDTGIVYDFYRIEVDEDLNDTSYLHDQEWEHEWLKTTQRLGHVVKMAFESGLADVVGGRDLQPGYYNYFMGDDPSKWASFVPLYQEVLMEELYAGINTRLYVDEGFLRYDLIAEPGADLSKVKLHFEGADDVWITQGGELAIATSLGVVTFDKFLLRSIFKIQVFCSGY